MLYRRERKANGFGRKMVEEGMERGMELGEIKALARTAIKYLVRRFGPVPEEFKVGIFNLDVPTLEVILDRVWDYESLDDVKRYIQ